MTMFNIFKTKREQLKEDIASLWKEYCDDEKFRTYGNLIARPDFNNFIQWLGINSKTNI